MPTRACAAEIAAILAERTIEFAAGSATLAPSESGPVAEIAATLRGCPDAAFEIGGHTDARARSPATCGSARSAPAPCSPRCAPTPCRCPRSTANGYGEAEPVADNATAEGRAQNRRIAFTLRAPAAEPRPARSRATRRRPASPRSAASSPRTSIEFAPARPTIAPESAPVIDAVAGVLRGCPDAAIEIGGHTDSEGSDPGNLRLSQHRAEAVLAAVRRPDLPLPGLTARGYGETEPIADNGTAEGRAQNRRIAFTAAAEEPRRGGRWIGMT